MFKTKPYYPGKEYLNIYKWRMYEQAPDVGPIALVTYRNNDILIELISNVPTLLDTKLHKDLYYYYSPVKSDIAKYVRLWTKSGLYKSMHLKDYLDIII